MTHVFNDNNKHKLPIFSCLTEAKIETEALNQLYNVANHPCVYHVAVAPDVHTGYGVPIGCILATKDVVIPNAVGVDIGCSMSATKTNIPVDNISIETLKRIIGGSKEYKGGIRANIPVGMSHNNNKQDHQIFADRDVWNNTVICKEELESAQYQLKSLGGGNHFIEIQAGDDGFVWVMIHSGSRNLGYKVGHHYNKVAENLCSLYKQDEVVKNGLAFLPRGTKEYDLYLAEMNICMSFAKANHELMQKTVLDIMKHIIPEMEYGEMLYTRHNYVTFEHHSGEDVLVHRKGAIMAREGVKAIIPGSQGTASYIVEGLGNDKFLCSASHGAGRVLSRTKAKAELDLKKEQALMGNIVHNITSEAQLDEAPSAYKNIDDVIKAESELVRPLVKLRPLAVVKG